jgi:hypothetical protein
MRVPEEVQIRVEGRGLRVPENEDEGAEEGPGGANHSPANPTYLSQDLFGRHRWRIHEGAVLRASLHCDYPP